MDNSTVLNSANTSGMDSELITKAKSGEESALGELYNHFFDPIFRFLYFRTGHKETAEDLTEEVFIKAFQKLSGIKQNERFSSWLYQIARNLLIDHYRKTKVNVPIEAVEDILEYEINIQETLDTDQNKHRLLLAVKQLPTEQRLVINMKFFEYMDNESVAQALDKSVGAIRVIQHRAILQLKELLR